MTEPLPPGSAIGILGGGQLGLMLSVAAARLGLRTHIFEPGASAPAARVAERLTRASYDDHDALRAFGASVDVVTYEFENASTAALDVLEALVPIRPGRIALATSQDRLAEKRFLQSIGLGVAPFAAVDDRADLDPALDEIGTPSILKTRRFGYDGKGQSRLRSRDDADQAIASMAGAPAVLEAFVDFEAEISVIAARSAAGEVRCFDPGRNVHVDGILHTTTVPAGIDAKLRGEAEAGAKAILDALDYVGVIGVEYFVTPDRVLVNEFAPGVHNSGHWTQNGCAVDQFEQHVRAIAGWALGVPSRHADVVMENLIGDAIYRVATVAQEPHVAVHAYGKTETKPGRKMGHLNRISPLTR